MVTLESEILSLYESIAVGLPTLIYAILVLTLGYISGRLIGSVVEKMLLRINIDKYVTEHEHLAVNLSSVFSIIAKWWIYVIAIQAVADILDINAMTNTMDLIIRFIPNAIGAIVVLIISYGIAIYAKENILGSRELYSNIVGKVIFFAILYIGLSTALQTLGIETYLVNTLLLVIVGSLSVGLAIAIGFGLKDVVAENAKMYARKTTHPHTAGHATLKRVAAKKRRR